MSRKQKRDDAIMDSELLFQRMVTLCEEAKERECAAHSAYLKAKRDREYLEQMKLRWVNVHHELLFSCRTLDRIEEES